jgi:hypothetical protein
MGAAFEGQVQKLLLIVCQSTIGLSGQLFHIQGRSTGRDGKSVENRSQSWRSLTEYGRMTYGKYFTKSK